MLQCSLVLVPLAQEYRQASPRCVPPAQSGNHHARESGEEECELFGDMIPSQEQTPEDPLQHEANQDELDRASIPLMSSGMSSSLEDPRCVNGELVRPTPPREDAPSSACQASTVCAPGGVRLGKAKAPRFGSRPGIVPSRGIPPPHLHQTLDSIILQLRIQRPIHCSGHLLLPRPKSAGGGGPPEGSGGGGTGSEGGDQSNSSGNARPGRGGAGSNSSGGGGPPGGNLPGGSPGSSSLYHLQRHLQTQRLRSRQEEQVIQAVLHRPHRQRIEQLTHGHH